MSEKSRHYRTYTYCLDNPTRFIDPDGMSANSTHTDANGNVIAVYNDGDNGVYKHADISKWDGESVLTKTGDGITKMGETKYWDEFADHTSKNTMKEITPGNYANTKAQIKFGASIDEYIRGYHRYAQKQMDRMGIIERGNWLKEMSARGRFLDIKDELGHFKGYKLGNFYVTGESAGNYLFGLNLDYARPMLYGNKDDFWIRAMKVVGHYHNTSNKVNNPEVHPYYGETNASGRWIANGFFQGENSLK